MRRVRILSCIADIARGQVADLAKSENLHHATEHRVAARHFFNVTEIQMVWDCLIRRST